ncbi:DSBA-like thioredoxin domain-containing protein [Immersiella caudata]|uniref:DSBA-like thioredoxin domain-containing protein n=1 Tax=Immersiella caudata TaxID=314043 RepID=A0AA39TNE9_9PEZI|nr:DSBA-like thioredoxin domain-containing protein [Immersiella caudata]
MPNFQFNIKIVSDVICPWCYIGKKRLEKAISLYQKTVPGGADDTFTVTWHPFYLDPNLPKVGINGKDHLAAKFGPERAAMLQSRLLVIGEAEGINFAGRGKIGNTRDAHRLIQLAKTKSNAVESKAMAELFRSHMEEGGDITSQSTLVAVGEKAGLDRSETQKWLEEGKGGDEVDREVDDAYRRGVSGVPNFTINGRYEVSGAQDPESFVQQFIRAKESAPGVSKTSGGPSC